MAVRDIEAFLRERALVYDPNLDTNPGAPFDVQVVQPMVRRLGTDPFTVDLSTFLSERMLQAFPDLANQEEDAITDLLNKPVTLLWDPIVREIGRVRQNLSFSDPTLMTKDEADALGANFYSNRKRGQFSRGPGRILFQNPQNASITPSNFFTSRGGLHYFPTEVQSIRTEEMLLNVTNEGLYYFDVNLIAEAAGVEYNIGPNELYSIANVPAATRVLNIRRFSFGESEESAQLFVSRIKQELGERSLVTLRGAAAKLVNNFPEVNRLNIIGFNDPEMQRDVLRGGGLGALQASGVAGITTADGEGAALTRRFFQSDGVDFINVFQALGAVSGWVLTVFSGFPPLEDAVQDLVVRRVVSATELDVDEQVFLLGASGLRWTLRKQELTLSHIPGGILFPNTNNGELIVPDNEVHIGGLYDTYVRGSGFEESTFIISAVTDDEPLLSGVQVQRADNGGTIGFSLNDYGTGSFDPTLLAQIADAVRFGYALQVQEGVNEGTYRIVAQDTLGSGELFLQVDPVPPNPDVGEYRWRLFDLINIDLLNPRETRVRGNDLSTLQNSNVVTVGAGTNLDQLGVSEDDTLVIVGGSSAGEYTVSASPLSPTSLALDVVLSSTASNLSYYIYRSNAGGGALVPPFIRLTKLELLDSSNQPVGTTIPYAKPIDVQTRAFQNPSRGVKHDFRNALLGIVSVPVVTNFGNPAGLTFTVYIEGYGNRVITLTTANATLATALTELNASFLAATGDIAEAFVQVGADRLGLRPVGENGYVAVIDGLLRLYIFGNYKLRTTGDIRTDPLTDFSALEPPIDTTQSLDVVQVLDGFNIGFYQSPFTLGYSRTVWPTATPSDALLVGELTPSSYLPEVTFSPEQRRRVQVGSRSLGSARVYFLEPTSFEVDAETRFSLDLAEAGIVHFIPDTTLEHQQIPPLPGDVTPTDGTTVEGSAIFTSTSQDFLLSNVQLGNRLVIKNHPIEGTIVLTDPVLSLGGLTLVFSLDGGMDRTVTFVRDDASLPLLSVSRSSVLEQINQVAGGDIVSLSGTNTIRFSAARDLVVRGTGTANSLILGDVANTSPAETFGPEDQSNVSPHVGTYVIQNLTQTTLTLEAAFLASSAAPFIGPTVLEQTFQVHRRGVQRISTTEMAENEAEAGLYYFDVELVSEGTGDFYNIESALQLTIVGYRSDGYYLTTADENLTFSEVERPFLALSRSILEEGVDDDPQNATQLTSENIQVTYERSQLITSIQNFLGSETERVICSNPLSRHLIPHFVRFDMVYVGGSREEVVLDAISEYTKELAPVDTLDSSDIQKFATDSGATYVMNPLDLLAVVHRVDRSVWAQRSQDRLSTGRLSAFIPERIMLVRDVSGSTS